VKKNGLRKMSLSKETVRILSGGALTIVVAGDSGGSDTGSALCPSDPRASGCWSCRFSCTCMF
jgi:hypothetical protein